MTNNFKLIRAVAVVIHENKLLVMHRLKNGKEFYTFPGGSVEEGENIPQAVVREICEEASIKVKIEKLLYHHIYDDGTEHYFYLCDYVSGEVKLGDGNEAEEMKTNPDNFYEPMWMEMAKLAQILLYPLEIRDWLLEDVKNDFIYTPREASLGVNELRQRL